MNSFCNHIAYVSFIIYTVKGKFCDPSFSLASGIYEKIKSTSANGECSFGVGSVGTYNSTFTKQDIAAQTFNNPAGQFNYTQLLNQAKDQTYMITELFDNWHISPSLFTIFLPNETIPTTDFLSAPAPNGPDKIVTTDIKPTKVQSTAISTVINATLDEMKTPTVETAQIATSTVTKPIAKPSPTVTKPSPDIVSPSDGGAVVFTYSLVAVVVCSLITLLL